MCFHARLAFSAAAELRPYYVYIYIQYICILILLLSEVVLRRHIVVCTAGCCYMENWSVIVSSTDISAAAAYFDVVVVRKELVEDLTAMVQIVYNVHAGCYIYIAVRN